MNKQECQNKLEEIQKIALEHNLSSAVVFFPDAITEEVQCRYIYSGETLECIEWIENILDKLRKQKNPSFAGYIDGVFTYGNGVLFRG